MSYAYIIFKNINAFSCHRVVFLCTIHICFTNSLSKLTTSIRLAYSTINEIEGSVPKCNSILNVKHLIVIIIWQ